MRNLTVKIPDEVYQAARLYAARNNTSIVRVFTEFLPILENANRIAPIFLAGDSPEMYKEILKKHPTSSERLPHVLWQSVLAVREFLRATGSTPEAGDMEARHPSPAAQDGCTATVHARTIEK